MKETVELVGQWLTLPDVAEELEVDIRRVHRLLDERAIVSLRIGERNVRSIPADFLQDGIVVESLKGTLSVLSDSGFSDEDAWHANECFAYGAKNRDPPQGAGTGLVGPKQVAPA